MKCKAHPRYVGKKKPVLSPHQCLPCWVIFMQNNKVNLNDKLTIEDVCGVIDALACPELSIVLLNYLEVE